MLKIIISPEAELQLDAIYENNGIYDGRNFTQAFINWNREFHCYVNAKTICQTNLIPYGWYNIGSIGIALLVE